ncbi:hypothetical protein [Pseudonocardia charpentierae]|uniref:Uncharacterized protein n=1 Tax=Pseudonocardia charpentierae TaxID=3075545 RepID=A0ABU2N6G3_9PSEU|nr:hypothetical protein [Pseudonocardia sp. DSM 45834]MDT0349526.1 hypothetical protein [Pseudonocardia sp. DSM 45834]
MLDRDIQNVGGDVDPGDATVRSWRLNRWMLVVSVIGVVVALVFGSCGGPPTSQQSVSRSGNNANQGGTQIVNQDTGSQDNGNNINCGHVEANAHCTVQIQDAVGRLSTSTPNDGQFKAELAKQSTTAPSGDGPWPFVVVDTGPEGLFARSSADVAANRLGYTTNRSIVWADCVQKSAFTPPNPINDVGPVWLRVHWKNDAPSKAALMSDPGDAEAAYMYRGLVVPYGHNGAIPACTSS